MLYKKPKCNKVKIEKKKSRWSLKWYALPEIINDICAWVWTLYIMEIALFSWIKTDFSSTLKKDKTLLLWLFLVYFTNTIKRCQIIYVLHLLDFLNHIYFRFAHLDIKTRLKTTILPAHACTFKTRTLQIFPVSWSGSQQPIPIPFPGLCSDFPPQLELYVCVFI